MQENLLHMPFWQVVSVVQRIVLGHSVLTFDLPHSMLYLLSTALVSHLGMEACMPDT